MIQRIIDWYNGYTLEEKLELEWLLETAYIKAIEEVKTLDVSELQKPGCHFDTKTKMNKKVENLSEIECCISGIARVVNIENMDYNDNRTKAQINMMKINGSSIRVKLGIDTISGKNYQFCQEYYIGELKVETKGV